MTFVLGTGIYQGHNAHKVRIDALSASSAFRKATPNMKAAFIAIENACEDAALALTELAAAATVLGSSYGEIETTTEFMRTLAVEKLARPFLFQSSLHNGTLGFLSVCLCLRGPSFTVSHRHFTGEKALELGLDLINSGAQDIALIVALDLMSHVLMPGLLPLLPINTHWEDGAAAIILASGAFAESQKKKPKAEILSVACSSDLHTEAPPAEHTFYDSDGLEKVALAIRSMSDDPSGVRTLTLHKINGTSSSIKLNLL